MQPTKEQLKEQLEAYKTNTGIETVLGRYNTEIEIRDFCVFIENDSPYYDSFIISIENVNTDTNDYYTMATYYSDKINKSIIIDWDVNVHFEDENEFIDTLYELNKQAHELEAKLNNH